MVTSHSNRGGRFRPRKDNTVRSGQQWVKRRRTQLSQSRPLHRATWTSTRCADTSQKGQHRTSTQPYHVGFRQEACFNNKADRGLAISTGGTDEAYPPCCPSSRCWGKRASARNGESSAGTKCQGGRRLDCRCISARSSARRLCAWPALRGP